MESTLKEPPGGHIREYVKLSTDGMTKGDAPAVDIRLELSDAHPDIEARYHDMAAFHALIDAHRSGEMILVGKNIFRPEHKHPYPDKLSFDSDLAVRLLRK